MSGKKSFFSAFARLIESLSYNKKVEGTGKLVLVSALLLTVTSSFATEPLALIFVVIFGGILALASGKVKEWLLVSALSVFFATLVSLPLLLDIQLDTKTNISPTLFIGRAAASASIFTAFYGYLGWRGVVNGLRGSRVLEGIGEQLAFTLRFIPLFILKTDRMLMAREARVFEKKRKPLFQVAQSVAGDILAIGFNRAYWARLSFTSRTFGSRAGGHIYEDVKVREAVIFFVAIMLSVFCLV